MATPKRSWIAVVLIGAALVVTGGPALLSRPEPQREAAAPVLRAIPYRIDLHHTTDAAPFAPDLVQAVRTALFIASAGPEDEIGADAAALSKPHLVLGVQSRGARGYTMNAAVMQQPLGTVQADTLASCGRNTLPAGEPLERGVAIGAYTAAYVECFRRFVARAPAR